MTAPNFGLCGHCAHQKLIGNTRGSTFSMCTLGTRDPSWPKYHPMPVRACSRYAPAGGGTGDAAAARASTS